LTDAEIRWFNPQQQSPNWFDPKEKQLACLIQEGEQCALCLMFNAGSDAVDFGLPNAPSGTRWHLAVDTSHDAPEGLFAAGDEPLWETLTYHLSPRSSVVLVALRAKGK
jgi:glycogen operon protein